MKLYKIVSETHVFLPAHTLINHAKIHIYFKIKVLKNETISSNYYQGVTRNLSYKNKNWSRNNTFNLVF